MRSSRDENIAAIRAEIVRVDALAAAADMAWRLHHKRPRHSWGWQSRHSALRDMRSALALQRETLEFVLTELTTSLTDPFDDDPEPARARRQIQLFTEKYHVDTEREIAE